MQRLVNLLIEDQPETLSHETRATFFDEMLDGAEQIFLPSCST